MPWRLQGIQEDENIISKVEASDCDMSGVTLHWLWMTDVPITCSASAQFESYVLGIDAGPGHQPVEPCGMRL